MTCRDGSVRICELFAAFLSDNLIITFNDITDRKRDEAEKAQLLAQLQTTLDATADGILVVNCEGKSSPLTNGL